MDLKAKPFYLSDEDIRWVEDTLASMTLEEKIGQIFCVTDGITDPEALKAFVEQYLSLIHISLVSTRQSHCFSLPFVPEAGTEYTWYVSRGQDRSAPARFETAYPFDAPWITPEQPVNHPALVRRFAAGTGLARLLITGLGLYEAYLNGNRVGDCYLTPGFSEYPHYLRFQTYDVTGLLRQENELRVVLGLSLIHI